MRTSYRAVAATGMVAMCATGLSVLGAGSASAAPATIPLENCTSSVPANVGDHVVVSAKTLLAPQMKDLGNIPVVGPLLTAALNPALASLALPPITVQQLPSGDLAPISGTQIANQLVVALPALAPAAGPLQSALGDSCTVTVVKKQAVAVPVVNNNGNATVPGAAPTAGPAPVAAETPAVTSYGRVPRTDYSSLTAVPAGGAGYSIGVAPTMAPKSLTGYGLPTAVGTTPTLAPQFGLLAAPPSVPSAAPSTQSAAVQPVMSEVTALPVVPASSTRVPAEAVLAALLLSLTTGALVRTWVLRRSAH